MVQQGEHLKTNENTIATHDTVIKDTGLKMARALLCHGHIDINLKN